MRMKLDKIILLHTVELRYDEPLYNEILSVYNEPFSLPQ